METGLALSILTTVTLATATGGAHRTARPPAPPPPQIAAWAQQAVPIMISTIDDLRVVEAHTADPGHVNPDWLGADDSRLQADLGAAVRLQPAPDRSMRTAWAATISDLGLADRTLRAAAIRPDPAAVTLTHQRFLEAGDRLLRLGQALSTGS